MKRNVSFTPKTYYSASMLKREFRLMLKKINFKIVQKLKNDMKIKGPQIDFTNCTIGFEF